jgi:hypothetical protein
MPGTKKDTETPYTQNADDEVQNWSRNLGVSVEAFKQVANESGANAKNNKSNTKKGKKKE